MLNMTVRKEASKTLTAEDVCWVFILVDKVAKTVDCSGKPLSPPGDDPDNPAPAFSSSTSF